MQPGQSTGRHRVAGLEREPLEALKPDDLVEVGGKSGQVGFIQFQAILADLKLPVLDQHDAYADALMTAMIYLGLSDLKARGRKIAR